MRIFFVSFVLIFTLLYQAWGQHFLVKTKDNDKSFLIRTKDDHIEPIEGNEANEAEKEERPFWLETKCWGKPCPYHEGMWMRGPCRGEEEMIEEWSDLESWNKCLKKCRKTTDSTGCAYSFKHEKCRAFKGRIKTMKISKERLEKEYNTMCIVFPGKIKWTSLENSFENTLIKAAKEFDFIWWTDNPLYWCLERGKEIRDLWCRDILERGLFSLLCTKDGIKKRKEKKYTTDFCEKKHAEKRESCRQQRKSSTKMMVDIRCDLDWKFRESQMQSFA